MDNNKPLLSIGDDGIKINLGKGDLIETNASKIFMQGVEQNVKGGTLQHRALEELTQISNTMEASEGGQILNVVEDGQINQVDNKMTAVTDGIILNKVSKKAKAVLLIILVGAITGIVGFWSDILSLVDYYF